MKLVKKLLATVCTVALTISTVSALNITANAEGELPTAYPVVTVDTEAKTAKIDVKLKNMPTESVDEYKDPLYMTYITLQIDVSSFSTETIANMTNRNFSTWKTAHYSSTFATGFTPAVSAANPGYLSYTGLYNSGELAKAADALVTSDMTIFTISNIPLSDEALSNGFDVDIRGTEDTNGFQFIVKNEYSDYLAEYKANENFTTAAVESASWAPSAPPAPSINWVDATHYKDYTSTIDDSKAAAYTVEFTGDGNTYDKMTWKVVSGETTKGCHVDVAIGGESTFKFGIAIGGLTSADITSVQAATGAQGTVAQ